MKLGVCYNLLEAELIAQLGYDYIEGHVTKIAAMSDGEFNALRKKLKALPISVEACCVLFPGDLKLTGPEADLEKVEAYVDGVFPRLEALGVKAVVFGSGGARRVPEGFDRAKAWHQLIAVSRLLGEKAAPRGFVVVSEPLNTGETNIINSQLDGLALVKDAEREGFRLLTDFYHLWLANEGREEVAACGGFLRHAHIANPVGRVAPAPGDGIPYDGFFAGLADAGYKGRLSVECGFKNPREELAAALVLLREKAAQFNL